MSEKFHWGPANPHPLSKLGTELVWEGKYDEEGHRPKVELPRGALALEWVEAVSPCRGSIVDSFQSNPANAGGKGPIAGSSFRNRLIWGDNKLILSRIVRGLLRDEIEQQGVQAPA